MSFAIVTDSLAGLPLAQIAQRLAWWSSPCPIP